MKLSFYGAAHEVTGSCFLFNINNKNIMIDCGMEQGKDVYENENLPISASQIDYIFVTHAHIDHSGLIPLMYSRGFTGQIYCTEQTCLLCDIMLRDSAHIHEFEAKWKNKKNKRAGREIITPIYTIDDAVNCMKLFVPCKYNNYIDICEGVKIKFIDAGHLLGSSSIEIIATENNITKTLVFSGDIGNVNKPILKDPTYIDKADYVIMESTYAGRYHESEPDYVSELTSVIQRTFDRGGNVIIPSFAVGRTQEILYFLRIIKERRLVKGHGDFKVIVDSPLAVEATHIFDEDGIECFDEETMRLVQSGINPICFKGLEMSVTVEDSRLINDDTVSKVIISASGMCEAGRIRHHLKHNLWRPECCILFVGYQAENTLGRKILNGITSVKLFGETINVNAEIAQIHSISGHADNNGLLKWVKNFSPKPKKVFVVHGDDTACDEFAKQLNDNENINAVAPYNGDGWDLIEDKQVLFSHKKRIEKKTAETYKITSAYARLLDVQKLLADVIEHNRGGTNKDLAKFADQLKALCDKWDR